MSALFSKLHPPRASATTFEQRNAAFMAGLPANWASALSLAGIDVTPDLAMTLSAWAGGVRMIGYDLGTCPWQVFKYDGDQDKARVRAGASAIGSGGIGSLVYLLRWQPNAIQTVTEYVASQVVQFFNRGIAYAEIAPGPSGFLEQLLPRHPDRTTPERLPSGRVRYRLTESNGQPRYLTQDEMHVVRDLSFDGGLSVTSRIQYGANSLGNALATQKSVGKFFKSGMSPAMLATYKGEPKGEDDETTLHKQISRYAAGSDNYAGLLLVPDYIDIKNLTIDPDKAQMMLAQEWGIREVARHLGMPASKLGIKDSIAYGSQVQDAVNYVIGTIRPLAVLFEQSAQRDLILAKDTYFTEFLLEALLRGDPEAQALFIDKMIRCFVMRPSEARRRLNLGPDPELDKIAATAFKPGQNTNNNGGQNPGDGAAARSSRVGMFAVLAMHDNAKHCLRRERAAVEKLAVKFADDPQGWSAGLREFYGEHASFLAEKMRLSHDIARGVAAQHGTEFEAKGMTILMGKAGEAWERFEADELTALALGDGNPRIIDGWFEGRAALPAPTEVITQ